MQINSGNFYKSKYFQGIVKDRGEYPLWSSFSSCPTARYVGGISRYVCECKETKKCPGVIFAAQQYEDIK